jgi:hypothetical protein
MKSFPVALLAINNKLLSIVCLRKYRYIDLCFFSLWGGVSGEQMELLHVGIGSPSIHTCSLGLMDEHIYTM